MTSSRRWFIRGCLILPLILCMTVWVMSYWHEFGIEYGHLGGEITHASVDRGFLTIMLKSKISSSSPGFHGIWKNVGWGYQMMPWGFHDDKDGWYGVPLMFFVVFLFLALVVVWLMTQHKINPHKAFPVEVGKDVA